MWILSGMSTGTPYKDLGGNLDKIPGGGLWESLGGNIYGNLTIICSRDLGENLGGDSLCGSWQESRLGFPHNHNH